MTATPITYCKRADQRHRAVLPLRQHNRGLLVGRQRRSDEINRQSCRRRFRHIMLVAGCEHDTFDVGGFERICVSFILSRSSSAKIRIPANE
jgi:hypothetical protein